MKKRRSMVAIPLLMLGVLLFISCSSSEGINSSFKSESGNFTDPRDGKTYKTVKIGNQWIMAENLAFRPERGNYWAYDDNDSNIVIYGYLYDWETARNIAPEGWHLPSRAEWDILLKALGADRGTFPQLERIFPKMIAGGTSGLDMLFAGWRTCDGEYKYQGDKARFWNSLDKKCKRASYGLDSNKAGLEHGLSGSTAPHAFSSCYEQSCPGYSVRLFMD